MHGREPKILAYASLFPRPSHHAVFDCLQYAKTILQTIKNWTVGRPENESKHMPF